MKYNRSLFSLSFKLFSSLVIPDLSKAKDSMRCRPAHSPTVQVDYCTFGDDDDLHLSVFILIRPPTSGC